MSRRNKNKQKQKQKAAEPKLEKQVADPARKIVDVVNMTDKAIQPMFANDNHSPPRILFSAKAWAQMYHLIPLAKKQNTEVAWYAPLIETDNEEEGWVIRVPEIFVPVQKVSGATCDEVEWGAVLQDAHVKGYSPSQMKVWCHLHPGESVVPSGTDCEQTQELLDNWNILLRGIFSASGKYKLDLWCEDTGYHYPNLNIEIEQPEDFELSTVAAHFKERVSKKVYAAPKTYGTQNRRYNPHTGTMNGVQHTSNVGGTTASKANGNTKLSTQLSLVEDDPWSQDRQLLESSFNSKKDVPLDGEVSSLVFLCEISGSTCMVSQGDVALLGEDADIVTLDGTEIGHSIISAYEEELVTIEEVLNFMKHCTNMDDEIIIEGFPKICLYYDLEEKSKLAVESEKKSNGKK